MAPIAAGRSACEIIGIVTGCSERHAVVWIESEKREEKIQLVDCSENIRLGDWLDLTIPREIRKIEPRLETRVLENGIVQV
ncbi:unnamed protein product [Gongylonema pulchrum]|uniref:TOBE_2 domain-containing protein n=1 Tax=Gongylonema pulchrum TaxID=637853 RepID=A0A183DJT0_9BILA|nr:unnamed protein product [Gongylonema pulchrum]